mgnify:CR=1 FL=1
MPDHKVIATMQQSVELSYAGSAMRFEVYSDQEMLGTIEIGKGTFRWKNKNEQDFEAIPWSDLFKRLNRDLPQ